MICDQNQLQNFTRNVTTFNEETAGKPGPTTLAAESDESSPHAVARGSTIPDESGFDASCTHRAARSEVESVAAVHSSLVALKQLFQPHRSVESLLTTATRLAVDTLSLEHCSICWIDENELCVKVRTSHTKKGATVNPGRAVEAVSAYVRRLRSNTTSHTCSTYKIATNPTLEYALEFTAPIRVKQQIVGYLYAHKCNNSNTQLSDTESSLIDYLSQNISVAIEIQQMREWLDCPYVALMLGPEEKYSFSSLNSVNKRCLDSVKDPDQLVRNIACRIFRDLRRAGFETKHILSVATEILGNMNDALRIAKEGHLGSCD